MSTNLKYKLKHLNDTYLLIVKPEERNIHSLRTKIATELKVSQEAIKKICKESSKDGMKVQVKTDANVLRLGQKETLFVDLNVK